jgi:AraC family transcriptional regulator of adaptative response/methylated-DNA-[protein]-cysteine methyltransferase
MSHTASRARETHESIYFATAECSLGSVLVAAAAQGICAILLGDNPDASMREVKTYFPSAQPRGDGDHREFDGLMAQVVGLIETPSRALDLPLDVRGTLFQQRVWRALREIPAGVTASYGAIAERIGAPQHAHAVGQACAANIIAVAIPCHRAVRKDGSLAGYRWGLERKRALLEREARPSWQQYESALH